MIVLLFISSTCCALRDWNLAFTRHKSPLQDTSKHEVDLFGEQNVSRYLNGAKKVKGLCRDAERAICATFSTMKLRVKA